MQTTLRSAGLAFLLLASAGSASATDQSAMEETNCLMACDANQEHCANGYSSGSAELFARRNFIVCEIEGFTGRQASPDDRRALTLPQYLLVFDLRAST